MIRTLILLALTAWGVSFVFYRITGRWLWQAQMRRGLRWFLIIGIALALGGLLERLLMSR